MAHFIFLLDSAIPEPVNKTAKLRSMKYKKQGEDHGNEGIFFYMNLLIWFVCIKCLFKINFTFFLYSSIGTFCTKVETSISRDLGMKGPSQPTPGGNNSQMK